MPPIERYLARSFTTDDRARFRIFAFTIPGVDLPPMFAAWVKLAANRDDEWGLYGSGSVYGNDGIADDDDRLDRFEAWLMRYWLDPEYHDPEYQLRRNVLLGRSWKEIAANPVAVTAAMELEQGNLDDVTKVWVSEQPVESLRHLRELMRKGERRWPNP